MNPAEDRKGGEKRGGLIPVYYPAEYSLERALNPLNTTPQKYPQRPQKELCAICGV